MAIVLLNLVVIRSTAIEQAASFYRLLGLDFVKHCHGSGPEHFFCTLDSMVFEIYSRQSDADSTAATRLGLCIDAIDTVIGALYEVGVTILSPPRDSSWGRHAVIADPDGHKIELCERTANEHFHDQLG